MATGAVDKISTAVDETVATLGHDVKEKDFEPPMPCETHGFIKSTASIP